MSRKKTNKDAASQKAENPDLKPQEPGYKRYQQEDEGGSSPTLWLITFTDIMALMLTFFVLLYSMSSPEEEQWERMTVALNKNLSKFYTEQWQSGQQTSISIDKVDMTQALNLNYLESLIREMRDRDENLREIVLIPQSNRLIISLPSDLLFQPGSAAVNLEGKKALFALGGVLSHIRNRIEVIGHTDPNPVSEENSEFSSNWELSLARALNVSSVMENVGYARPMIVRGLSFGRYDELEGTVSEDEKLNLSRRVDLVIMRDDGSMRLIPELGNSG